MFNFPKLQTDYISKLLSKVVSTFLIFATIAVSVMNLVSVSSTLHVEAATTDIIGSETTKTDINTVEFEVNLKYKFGSRFDFNVNQINSTDIKKEICGDSITFGTGKFDFKYDSTAGTTVIKTLSSKCGTTIKQSWLKLLWDNGLVGWILSPNQNQSSAILDFKTFNTLNPLNLLDSISVSAQAPTPTTTVTNPQTITRKTCKDFTFQVRDLRILNQFPNLDLDDDGIGCEHLPVDPNDSFVTGNQKLLSLKTLELDTNKDSKVTCIDFASQVIDTEVLTVFPRLDADGDGIGCESNPATGDSTVTSNYGEESDLTLPDIALSQSKLESKIDWSKTGLDLQKALQSDYNYLFQADSDCHTFDLGCVAVNSIAGLGKKGLWIFKFLTGVLQGVGQSIVDLLKQVWDLVTNTVETVSKIIQAFQNLISNPSLLIKIFQDDLSEMLGADTLERANKIGRVIGGIIPDVVVGVFTAGVGAIGLKALEGLNLSQKVISTTIKVSKFIGKTLQLVSGKFEIVLKPLTSGGLGLLSKKATNLVQTLDDAGFDELVGVVEKEGDKLLISRLREVFNSCWEKLICSFGNKNVLLTKFSKTTLINSAKLPDRNGFTKVGRALQKHSAREGSLFSTSSTITIEINQEGLSVLDEILNDTKSVAYEASAKSVGKIIDIRQVSGKGARFDKNGKFIGFLDPFKK